MDKLAKDGKMLRHSQLSALLIGLLILLPTTTLAQSQGRGGYWDRGRWIGYMPPHLKNSDSGPTLHGPQLQEMVLDQDETPRLAGRSSLPRGRQTASARQKEVVSSAYEEVEPIPVGEELMMNGEGCSLGGAPGTCGPPAECGYDCGYDCGYTCGGCTWVTSPRFWTRVEYLGWWTAGMDVPALVTTSPLGTAQGEAGVLGEPGTSVLFGDESINADARSGIRTTLGMWLGPCQTHALEFTYLGLGTESTDFFGSDSGYGAYSILARPFGNLEELAQDSNLIAYPNVYSGWVSVHASTEVNGTELLVRRAMKRCPMSQVDLLIGWRWLQVKDRLLIEEHSTFAQTDSTIDLYDNFDAKNNFHGAEFGLQWIRPVGCLWTFEAVGKMAIGNTRSLVNINGQTTTVDPDGTTVTSGGLLTQGSNSGLHSRDHFATVTEIGLTVRRRFTSRLEMTFGYTFLYWSDVLRAGDQVDLDVNLAQDGSATQIASPGIPMKSDGFWAQGLQFGLQYDF